MWRYRIYDWYVYPVKNMRTHETNVLLIEIERIYGALISQIELMPFNGMMAPTRNVWVYMGLQGL